MPTRRRPGSRWRLGVPQSHNGAAVPGGAMPAGVASPMGARQISRRRGVYIIDGSDDPDIDGWRTWQPRADEFRRSAFIHEWGV
jgi:hypothetical protein